tara:strand:- start:1268 stop:1438 length:171 start_codon:yes stop_codon:yes gene_type:complete
MKSFKIKNLSIIHWGIWLILIVVWNFCFPKALPFEDVIVSVILSIAFIIIKKKKAK